MKKFKEYLALLLACTMTVCACPVYGASRGLLPETSVPEDTFVYEETEDFVPGEVIVCVAGGAETLAEDMTEAGSENAALLGASGTGTAKAAEALSLFTCTMTALEAALEAGALTTEEAAEALLGAASPEEQLTSEILLLKTEEGKEEDCIAFLETLPHVEFAELNYRFELTGMTGDPADGGGSSPFITSPSAWEQQWAYNGTSRYGMGEAGIPIWEDDRINMPVNPETEDYDEDQIVVALLDSGVDYNNPEIRPVLWNCPEDLQETLGCGEYGFNAVAANTGEGDPTDPYDDLIGHGTHCAGIIGAEWKNGGIYGIANNVKIMAVKVGSEGISNSDALAGFYFVKRAIENGVNVAVDSNSWGGSYHGHALERAIIELGKLGTLTVFAAGNDSTDTDIGRDTVSAVTADPYVLSVNSHDDTGELSSFSNFGLKTTHVSAPGGSIFSAAALVRGSIDPADTAAYKPFEDAATGRPCYAPVEKMTIASPSGYVASENAFCLRSARLATASTAEVGAIDNDNIYLVAESTVPGDEPPYVELLVDTSEMDLSKADSLFFGFRLARSGWTAGLQPNYDRMLLTVTAEDGAGNVQPMYEQGYYISRGKPVTVSMPAVTDAAFYRIRLVLEHYDKKMGRYFYIDPVFAAFDDFLFTEKCSAYVTMSGTSMACPAVSGEAAVLAASFARLPSETRAKELQARILGAAVPFKNEEDKNKNRAGGYANLVKAMTEDYVPVIQGASFDKQTGILTLSGYFFPDAEKAAAEGWYILLDNTKITGITWSEDGTKAELAMGSADLGAKEYAIRMLAKNAEKSGRNFLWIDTGATADGFMPRIDISGTDPDMYDGKFLGMIPLNEKLYLLEYLTKDDREECGFVVWEWDIKKGGAWRRVNETPVEGGSLGNPDLEVKEQTQIMAFQGKIVFPLECMDPVTETYVTYLVTIDPETGKAESVPASRENHQKKAVVNVVSLGEKLALVSVCGEGNTPGTEISLFEMTKEGKLTRKAAHQLAGTLLSCDIFYQEDGTFLGGGTIESSKGMTGGVFRFRVTEASCTYEQLSEEKYYYSGEIRDPASQDGSYWTAPLMDALITTGIQNTIGSDTHILKGLSPEGIMIADPLCADTAKLLNFAVAATGGKYYVLAQSRNGGEGRCFFCCQDLAELGLKTIKNPGDTEKPVPPGPTPTPGPVYGGGGGTVTTNGLAYSKFWVQQNGIWKVVDKNGLIVKNAWLCDDAVTANGNNVWYLLKADGTMASDGLLMDASGNYYSLEQEHKGYFGSLRYKDGYYNVGGKQVYLTFCRDHNGAFGAVLNPDGLAALKAAYGVAAYANGNESIRYTSKF